MMASDVARATNDFIAQHGDRPVYFSDRFYRYGVVCHAESAPNYDAPQAMLVKTFSLATGVDGPHSPIDLERPCEDCSAFGEADPDTCPTCGGSRHPT